MPTSPLVQAAPGYWINAEDVDRVEWMGAEPNIFRVLMTNGERFEIVISAPDNARDWADTFATQVNAARAKGGVSPAEPAPDP